MSSRRASSLTCTRPPASSATIRRRRGWATAVSIASSSSVVRSDSLGQYFTCKTELTGEGWTCQRGFGAVGFGGSRTGFGGLSDSGGLAFRVPQAGLQASALRGFQLAVRCLAIYRGGTWDSPVHAYGGHDGNGIQRAHRGRRSRGNRSPAA